MVVDGILAKMEGIQIGSRGNLQVAKARKLPQTEHPPRDWEPVGAYRDSLDCCRHRTSCEGAEMTIQIWSGNKNWSPSLAYYHKESIKQTWELRVSLNRFCIHRIPRQSDPIPSPNKNNIQKPRNLKIIPHSHTTTKEQLGIRLIVRDM